MWNCWFSISFGGTQSTTMIHLTSKKTSIMILIIDSEIQASFHIGDVGVFNEESS
jgi:hypothetical protein